MNLPCIQVEFCVVVVVVVVLSFLSFVFEL